jgi:hypothetical protein
VLIRLEIEDEPGSTEELEVTDEQVADLQASRVFLSRDGVFHPTVSVQMHEGTPLILFSRLGSSRRPPDDAWILRLDPGL